MKKVIYIDCGKIPRKDAENIVRKLMGKSPLAEVTLKEKVLNLIERFFCMM